MIDEKYYTHCFLCEREWGAGELHVMHRVTCFGKNVCSVFLCVDCAEKQGLVGGGNEKA